MIWMTWQQHRLQILVSGIILVLLALLLLDTGLAIADYYQANVAGCVGIVQPSWPCSSSTFIGFNDYINSMHELLILPALPALVGIFIGAPLLAWEREHGTYLLAWTQGVTRQRWLMIKLSVLIGVTVVAFLLQELLMVWWNGPVVAALGPFIDFDMSGVVPMAYALCALALGVAVGTIVGRSIGAMATTFVLFVCLRVGISQLRTYFLPTVTSLQLFRQPNPHIRDWVIHSQLVDAQGYPADRSCSNVIPSEQTSCMQSHNVHFLTVYHPASQFWLFQGIEFAIFMLLAVALFTLTFWWVQHRVH